ncbi:MAG: hypothetical protein RLZZ282_1123, partial [Verrucomicrobiota bacterium]
GERTLHDVQTDMDSRYKISPKARQFADGPGVLPDVNEIPQVEPTGKNGSPPKATPVETSEATPPKPKSSQKSSLRPANRR